MLSCPRVPHQHSFYEECAPLCARGALLSAVLHFSARICAASLCSNSKFMRVSREARREQIARFTLLRPSYSRRLSVVSRRVLFFLLNGNTQPRERNWTPCLSDLLLGDEEQSRPSRNVPSLSLSLFLGAYISAAGEKARPITRCCCSPC